MFCSKQLFESRNSHSQCMNRRLHAWSRPRALNASSSASSPTCSTHNARLLCGHQNGTQRKQRSVPHFCEIRRVLQCRTHSHLRRRVWVSFETLPDSLGRGNRTPHLKRSHTMAGKRIRQVHGCEAMTSIARELNSYEPVRLRARVCEPSKARVR